MQTNIILNSVKFFSPKSTKRGNKCKKPHLTYALTSEKLKNSNYTFNFSQIVKENKLEWDFIKIGTFGTNLIITKGDSEDGLALMKSNKTVSSKSLIEDLLEFFNIAIPQRAGERIELYFNYEKIDKEIYMLKKI